MNASELAAILSPGGLPVKEDGLALLRGICENPDDDGIRLIYADWLEENGEAIEAQAIRHEIAAWISPASRKMARILDDPWIGMGPGITYKTARGLPYAVRLSLAEYRAKLPRIFQWPIIHVEIADLGYHIANESLQTTLGRVWQGKPPYPLTELGSRHCPVGVSVENLSNLFVNCGREQAGLSPYFMTIHGHPLCPVCGDGLSDQEFITVASNETTHFCERCGWRSWKVVTARSA